jgi:hypothetical protein
MRPEAAGGRAGIGDAERLRGEEKKSAAEMRQARRGRFVFAARMEAQRLAGRRY